MPATDDEDEVGDELEHAMATGEIDEEESDSAPITEEASAVADGQEDGDESDSEAFPDFADLEAEELDDEDGEQHTLLADDFDGKAEGTKWNAERSRQPAA